MTFNLTPTELARLHTEGSVRIVRKCEPQPTVFANDGWPMEYGVISPESVNIKPIRTPSPFPPAGTRETIDGVDCVWGEVECKQLHDITFIKNPEQNWDEYFFTTTIRKDTE